MATNRPPSANSPDTPPPHGDPWQSFGYILGGVGLYGLAGWGLDRWLGTNFIVAIGIVLGAALGVYMTWARYRQPPEPSQHPQNKTSS